MEFDLYLLSAILSVMLESLPSIATAWLHLSGDLLAWACTALSLGLKHMNLDSSFLNGSPL